MIKKSINQLEALLKLITSGVKGYYIEQKNIATKVDIDGHIYYSKYRYFSGTITDILIKQHLSKNINLAISLENYSAIVFKYSGEERAAFLSLIKYYITKDERDGIYIISDSNLSLELYIRLKCANKDNFNDILQKVTTNLDSRISQEWIALPNILYPDIG